MERSKQPVALCAVGSVLLLLAIAPVSWPAHGQGSSSTNTSQIATLNSNSLRAALLFGPEEMGRFSSRDQRNPSGSSLPLTAFRHDQPEDPWFAMDKLQHVAFSFFITTGTQYGLVNKLTMGERDALPLSAGFSLLMGVSKEVYDRRSERGVFSRRDLIADGVGIALAAGLILL